MGLSARNQLTGTVKSVKLGTVMAEVVLVSGARRSCRRSRATPQSDWGCPRANT